jgi:hypothetical protein
MSDFRVKRTLDASKGKKRPQCTSRTAKRRRKALSDCCMVAAESFCGIEQTTPRVKPVEAIAGAPDVALCRIWNSHDDKGVQWDRQPMEAQ